MVEVAKEQLTPSVEQQSLNSLFKFFCFVVFLPLKSTKPQSGTLPKFVFRSARVWSDERGHGEESGEGQMRQ